MTYWVEAGDFTISTDPARLDLDAVHRWLSELAYWSTGRTRETVERSVAHSIPFGAYRGDDMVGFARVVTDRSTFAWLCDVFVLPDHRGAGLGQAIVAAAVAHPDLKDVKRFLLATLDAHDLYRKQGFEVLDRPERFMIRRGTTA